MGGNQVIPRPPFWRPGAPPPWSSRPIDPERFSLRSVAARVAVHDPRRAAAPAANRGAAVLVALAPGARGAELILTRRSHHVSTHRGEVSFPGGRIDPGETPEEAALREAHEEVGLDPALVTLVGELDHFTTVVTVTHIVPVVATLDRIPPLTSDTPEVDRIFTVPLAALCEEGVCREELWAGDGGLHPIYFFELEDETVWGATARILFHLLELLTEDER